MTPKDVLWPSNQVQRRGLVLQSLRKGEDPRRSQQQREDRGESF